MSEVPCFMSEVLSLMSEVPLSYERGSLSLMREVPLFYERGILSYERDPLSYD
jgi:hypothetical protein